MTRLLLLAGICIIVTTMSKAQRAISNDEFAQQETSVAISRTNPNLIVVGSNDDAMDVRSMPAYVTSDAGKSWETYRLPKAPLPYGVVGDPVVIADNDGGFYYSNLLFHDATGWYNILVSHSQDGKSWTYNSPVIAEPSGSIEDKEWLALDRSPLSPTYGRLYVTWTRLNQNDPSKAGTFIAWSDDTCKTWTAAKRIGSFVGTYTLVQVGADGTIYVSYSQYSEYKDSIGHYMSVSHDFGQTFTEMLVAKFINYPFSPNRHKPALKGGRVVSFPYLTFTLDQTRRIIHAIYGSFDTSRKAAIQQYKYSTDDGLTWTESQVIGEPQTLNLDRFQPWITLDKTTGIAHASYYSSERDEKNLLTSVYYARIEPDTILTQSLTDSAFNPLNVEDFHGDPFIGDYTGADLWDKTYAFSWTQNRTGYKDGEIFIYINPNIDSLKRGVISRIEPAKFFIESVTPNPIQNGKCTLHIRSHISSYMMIELVDLQGIVQMQSTVYLTTGEQNIELPLRDVLQGTYFLRLTSGIEVSAAKILVN